MQTSYTARGHNLKFWVGKAKRAHRATGMVNNELVKVQL
jgi:hypothetical protein